MYYQQCNLIPNCGCCVRRAQCLIETGCYYKLNKIVWTRHFDQPSFIDENCAICFDGKGGQLWQAPS